MTPERAERHRQPVEKVIRLTPRQQEVLKLVAIGLSDQEIARELDISTHTVKSHVTQGLRKLKVQSRTQATIKGIKSGLFSLEKIVAEAGLNPDKIEHLPPKLHELVRLLADEKNPGIKQIARKLGRAKRTVNNQLSEAYKILEVQGRIQAALLYLAYKKEVDTKSRGDG